MNDKYLSESKQLYKEFTGSMSKLKEGEKGNISVESRYVILTDNVTILSVQRYTDTIQASSSTVSQFDTVDKKNEVLLTLNSLFKDDRYLQVISENIKEQMKRQMAEDPEKIYWVEEDDLTAFKGIDENQNFYINEDGKLVIAFNSYEAAPGYMGAVEFIIPTNVLSDLLLWAINISIKTNLFVILMTGGRFLKRGPHNTIKKDEPTLLDHSNLGSSIF
nr:RsiV family protein [Peribacillus simplex]